ncbi:helix-turn-helix domain-containing protein [Cellulosimicrobium marinum]|uniref:helix-turn-helix domain-containing protein n=1 Tax=Cellulosimicrobium marinum TaxID=1638992 RepID=UPI001E3D19F2|nr:helix-turn-helix transcriptional regulator [Cellulosimicrobium marinum]MCB7136985.1 helix-turn-helix transcriptional regulator [Cellulosimicrobium marinum]
MNTNTTRIPELRRSRGWTQERLAEASSVAVRTIQRLESGADASLESLSLIAGALDVPVSELFQEVARDDFAASVQALDERTRVEQANAQRAQRARVEQGYDQIFWAVGVVLFLAAVILYLTDVTGWQVVLVPVLVVGAGRPLLQGLKQTVIGSRLDARFPLTASAGR